MKAKRAGYYFSALVLVLGLIVTKFCYADDLLQNYGWIHGSEKCKTNTDPAIEVLDYNPSTYILRENKYLSYEAPFIYVLIGEQSILLLDTGTTSDAAKIPLYNTIQKIINQPKIAELPVIVAHSHGHLDHISGDKQFASNSRFHVITPNNEEFKNYFNLSNWPNETSTFNLGNRELTIIPTPGHHKESIAIYDKNTQWLLTGDTLYPGKIYIKDWQAYSNSIQRLTSFTQQNPTSLLLGSHIEISKNGKIYKLGNHHQPNEASLVLSTEDLQNLNKQLKQTKGKPKKIELEKFTVAPISALQRLLSNILS